MHPNSPRPVHSAEFKSQVLADCRQFGVSLAAVALSHGLNVNFVRKWLDGRGLKRCGLATPEPRSADGSTAGGATVPPAMQFVPLALSAPSAACRSGDEAASGGQQFSVRWPIAESAACGAWLSDLAATLR